MQDFETPSLKVYRQAHTHLNNYIKISIAAITYLFNAKSDNHELSELISNLIQESGERWTPRRFDNPKEELKQLKNDLAKTGVMWVYSAFDVFYKEMEGHLSLPNTKSKTKKEKKQQSDSNDSEIPEEEKKEAKINKLYKKLNWPLDEIKDLLPILKFYDVLRHCVAHRSGYPSDQLVSLVSGKPFTNAIANWKTKFKGKNISPPPIVSNEQIELRGHHAILYSETCLRVAKDINDKYAKTLNVNELIGKIIKKYLIETKELILPYGADYSRYIAVHLKEEYNIKLSPYNKIYEYYGSDEETKKKHNEQYNKLMLEARKPANNKKRGN